MESVPFPRMGDGWNNELLHQVEQGLLPDRPVVQHAGELLDKVEEEAAERRLQRDHLRPML